MVYSRKDLFTRGKDKKNCKVTYPKGVGLRIHLKIRKQVCISRMKYKCLNIRVSVSVAYHQLTYEVLKGTCTIGVGRFRILGGQGLEFWGEAKGDQILSRHMTS